MNTTQELQSNGQWTPAKEIPYYPNWLENLKCTFGIHELKESKRFLGVKVCFRCGKRRIYKDYAY